MFAMYDIRSQCAFAVDVHMRNILRRRGVTREKAVFVFLATLTREGGSQPSTREIAEGRVLVDDGDGTVHRNG